MTITTIIISKLYIYIYIYIQYGEEEVTPDEADNKELEVLLWITSLV